MHSNVVDRQGPQAQKSGDSTSGGSAGKQVRSADGPVAVSEEPAPRGARGDGGAASGAGDWTMTPGLCAAMGISGDAGGTATSFDAAGVQSLDETSSSETLSVRVPMAPGAAPQQGAAAAGPGAEQAGLGAGTAQAVADQVDEPIISDHDTISPTIGYTGSITRGGITLSGEFGRTDSSPSLKNITITQASGAFTVTATYELVTKWDTQRGTGPASQVNVPNENASALTKANYATAVSDLTPNMSDEGGRPPRTTFWAQDLTERHEQLHAREHQATAKEGLKRALTWLSSQTASSKADVEAQLATLRTKVVQYILANGAGSVGELHAYGDGAPLYLARADAIKKKGDGGGYP
jgi:hypothetical protein